MSDSRYYTKLLDRLESEEKRCAKLWKYYAQIENEKVVDSIKSTEKPIKAIFKEFRELVHDHSILYICRMLEKPNDRNKVMSLNTLASTTDHDEVKSIINEVTNSVLDEGTELGKMFNDVKITRDKSIAHLDDNFILDRAKDILILSIQALILEIENIFDKIKPYLK